MWPGPGLLQEAGKPAQLEEAMVGPDLLKDSCPAVLWVQVSAPSRRLIECTVPLYSAEVCRASARPGFGTDRQGASCTALWGVGHWTSVKYKPRALQPQYLADQGGSGKRLLRMRRTFWVSAVQLNCLLPQKILSERELSAEHFKHWRSSSASSSVFIRLSFNSHLWQVAPIVSSMVSSAKVG